MRFTSAHGLSPADAEVLSASRSVGDYFEDVARSALDSKAAANWVMGEVLATLNETGGDIEDFPVSAPQLGEVIALVTNGTLSRTAARAVFATLLKEGGSPRSIAERDGLLQVGDDSALVTWIDEVLAENANEAQRYAGGEKKLQGVLVGLVMKKSKGRADPRKVNQLLAERAGR
jgi:aspartyl-tRNA(Asn)/glutamyl-tRNA(Gln) amidotransferase subunit B